MKTQYYTASTLDGFIADEHDGLEWLFQFGDAPGGDYEQFIDGVGALAMGSHTYEWMLKHLFAEEADHPQPWPYSQPTWVFTSRELPDVPDANVRFVRGDVRAVHEAMASEAQGKNIWLVGGGDLVGQFHDHGLLDEIIVTIASVTLGVGKPLLPRSIETPPLKLISAERWDTSFAQLRYEVQKPS
ncbi:MAG: dihydrofolate reductase family protein [Gemmatimonas sp.]